LKLPLCQPDPPALPLGDVADAAPGERIEPQEVVLVHARVPQRILGRPCLADGDIGDAELLRGLGMSDMLLQLLRNVHGIGA